MAITTKFLIGDIAYPKDKALQGILTPVTVVDIKAETSLNSSATISYRTHGISSFIVTWYLERELLTFIEAKTEVLDSLITERDDLQARISRIRGTFKPFPSFVNVV